jgi:hypothetical protein
VYLAEAVACDGGARPTPYHDVSYICKSTRLLPTLWVDKGSHHQTILPPTLAHRNHHHIRNHTQGHAGAAPDSLGPGICYQVCTNTVATKHATALCNSPEEATSGTDGYCVHLTLRSRSCGVLCNRETCTWFHISASQGVVYCEAPFVNYKAVLLTTAMQFATWCGPRFKRTVQTLRSTCVPVCPSPSHSKSGFAVLGRGRHSRLAIHRPLILRLLARLAIHIPLVAIV